MSGDGGGFSKAFSDEFEKGKPGTDEETHHILTEGGDRLITEDGDAITHSGNTNHAMGASEFFRTLNISITQALRDLLTIAAVYSHAKKSQQEIISSTCLLFTA